MYKKNNRTRLYAVHRSLILNHFI